MYLDDYRCINNNKIDYTSNIDFRTLAEYIQIILYNTMLHVELK